MVFVVLGFTFMPPAAVLKPSSSYYGLCQIASINGTFGDADTLDEFRCRKEPVWIIMIID